jgi:general secretion pathway protein J
VRRRCEGLTLIELLVAVTIFALLSGMAYRALTVVLESRSRIELENRKWRELALFFARLEQDIATVAARPVRDGDGNTAPALTSDAAGMQANDRVLVLTRTSLAAATEGLEPPRRVGYRLRGDVVELLTWPALDQGRREEPRAVPVLREVRELRLAYVDRRGARHSAWPPTSTANSAVSLPTGVEIALTLASGEQISRLLPTTARSAQP